MSFYVSVFEKPERPDTSRKILALGPFNAHGEALSRVDDVRRYVGQHDRRGHWYAFGTCRDKAGRRPGALNDVLDYTGPGELP